RRQRRRRPRPARADSEIDISPHISEAFELVPEIGEGVRWYDYAYRLLGWMVAGWRRKLIPGRARTWLNDRSNDLLQFNEHDRNKVGVARLDLRTSLFRTTSTCKLAASGS